MVYEADTLKEILRTTWSLTGLLAAEGTPAADKVVRPVRFFAREQIKDKIESKSVNVVKSTPLINQRVQEFITEETDEFKITVIKKLSGVDKIGFDESETDAEDIETEINRIIKLTYNPQSGIGVFWTSDFVWRNVDQINIPKSDAYIVRELTLRLTVTRSRSNSVFDSLARGALFDLALSSNMDNPPGADFTYAQVFDVENSEGFNDVELDVTKNPDGIGIPLFFAGKFAGTMVMNAYVAAADIGSTDDKINQIYKRKNNGEKVEAALVRTYTNNNSQTLTLTTIVRIQTVKIVEGRTGLMTWQMLAKIIKPTTMVIS